MPRLQARQRQDAQQSQKMIQNGCSTSASAFRPAIPRARSKARQVRGRLRSAWHHYVDGSLELALLEETAWGAVSLAMVMAVVGTLAMLPFTRRRISSY